MSRSIALRLLAPALRAVALLLSLNGSPGLADPLTLAQAPSASDEQRIACAADFRRLCPGIAPGGGRVKACFAENIDKLSPPCRAAYLASLDKG
jgi:hypothetical protein